MSTRSDEKHSARDLESNVSATGHFAVKPSIDLSHHLSDLAKSRVNSPLKDLFRYASVPGTIMMAGGLPHPDYFPFDSLSAQALTPDAFSIESGSNLSSESSGMLGWLWELFGSSVPTKTMEIPKYDKDPAAVQLSRTLQYNDASGHPALQEFVSEFMKSVFKPMNSEMGIFLHAGSTDAWTKCISTFCNPGELFLAEKWAYTSALAAAKPYGVLPVGVDMDGEGLRADALEDILANWDVDARGAARPHLLYTVPVGQNPCGTTMGAKRKKAIYDVCVKYDVMIVEDDPYYFLQVGEYQDPRHRVRGSKNTDEEKEFLDSLVPSFLKFDYQGRVVRLDTFSKTIAPGSRLGWYTANPLFIERLWRATETSTQAPSGFTQSFVAQLLTKQWKYSGWIRWLQGIKAQYTIRRDMLVDALGTAFEIEEELDEHAQFAPLSDKVRVFVGRSKRHSLREKKSKVLFTFVAPTAGMFIWLKVHLCNHPAYNPNAPLPKLPNETLEYQLWQDLALGGILLAPGWVFGTDPDESLINTAVDAAERPLDDKYRTLSEGGRYGHLRISYSNPTADELRNGLGRFARIMDKQFFTS